MAWIELHQAVRDHRKIVRLAELLDMPEPHVVGHIAYLWLWALDNAPDGQLDCSPRTIARAAWWEGDPQHLTDALVACGLLEQSGDVLVIHDWESYAGKLIGQRKANAERQARHRDRNRPERDVTPSQQPSNAHVTVTSPSRNSATVPNPTQQNKTQPDQETTRAPARGPSQSEPFDALVALCEATGADVADLSGSVRSRQAAKAKQLLAAGMTVGDIGRCAGYCASQDWRTSPVDMFTVEKERSKWELAGKPASARASIANGRASPVRETVTERNLRNLHAAFDGPEPEHDNIFDTTGVLRQ